MIEQKVELPPFYRMFTEPLGLLELINVMPVWKTLEALPNGKGEPAMVIPGLTTNDISTTIVRRFLNYKGFNVYGWKLGVNIKYSRELEQKLIDRIKEISDRHQQKVSIIGWSLGGVTMRILAQHAPDRIRQLIALGAPFANIKGPTNVTWWYELVTGEKVTDFRPQWAEAAASRPLVPSTSIYSKKDGMVSWEYCIDKDTGPMTQNIEVFCNHLGFGMNPLVWYVLVDRLSQPEDRWQLFDVSLLKEMEKRSVIHF